MGANLPVSSKRVLPSARPGSAVGTGGAICSALRDLDELAEPISDVEEDGKGLPILLRQYANVGGRLVGFRSRPQILRRGRWPDESSTCARPILGPRALQMGREGYAGFRQFHLTSISFVSGEPASSPGQQPSGRARTLVAPLIAPT